MSTDPIRRWARAGLLERTALPGDRRAVHLRLTPSAQELVAQVRAIEDAMYDFLEVAVPQEALNTVILTLSTLVSGQTAGLALERRKHHQADHTSPK